MEGVMMAAESAAQTVDNATAGVEVVASPEGAVSENNAEVQGSPEGGERSPVQRQNRDTNAYFKGLRQKAEQQAKEQQDADEQADFESRVRESDLYRELEARANRDRMEADMLRSDAELHRVDEQMRADLEAIQKLDPTVRSLEDLGDDFVELVREHDGPTAFLIMKGLEALKPPITGEIGGMGSYERDFTSDELDRLQKGDLIKNDNLYKKAMRSLLGGLNE